MTTGVLMESAFFHPLTFALASAAIASTAIFGSLTVTFFLQHRAAPDDATVTYAWFTASSAINALLVAATLIPLPDALKLDAFRLGWVFGCLSVAAWLGAVSTFIGMEHRGLQWTRRVLTAMACVPAFDVVWVNLGGDTLFFSMTPRPSDWPLLVATGNLFSFNLISSLTAFVVIGSILSFTLIMVRWIGRHRPEEQALRGAVMLTGIAGLAEVVLGGGGTPIPLVFLANHVEAMRISWVSTVRMGAQLEQLRHQEQAQEVLIVNQREQIRQTDVLARVGQETARITHDLRNPLSAVLAGLELLEELVEDDEAPEHEVSGALQGTRRALDHTLSLVNRLTRQARRADDKRPQPLAVGELLETTKVLCHQRLEGIEVQYDLGSELSVRGHEVALVQLLVNLVSNAADALRAHPEPWIRVTARAHQEMVEMTVTDAGLRPPDSVVDRMFRTRFTTRQQGTGLGLEICARIVAEHDGHIEVDRHAKNTTVVVRLPAAAAVAA